MLLAIVLLVTVVVPHRWLRRRRTLTSRWRCVHPSTVAVPPATYSPPPFTAREVVRQRSSSRFSVPVPETYAPPPSVVAVLPVGSPCRQSPCRWRSACRRPPTARHRSWPSCRGRSSPRPTSPCRGHVQAAAGGRSVTGKVAAIDGHGAASDIKAAAGSGCAVRIRSCRRSRSPCRRDIEAGPVRRRVERRRGGAEVHRAARPWMPPPEVVAVLLVMLPAVVVIVAP